MKGTVLAISSLVLGAFLTTEAMASQPILWLKARNDNTALATLNQSIDPIYGAGGVRLLEKLNIFARENSAQLVKASDTAFQGGRELGSRGLKKRLGLELGDSDYSSMLDVHMIHAASKADSGLRRLAGDRPLKIQFVAAVDEPAESRALLKESAQAKLAEEADVFDIPVTTNEVTYLRLTQPLPPIRLESPNVVVIKRADGYYQKKKFEDLTQADLDAATELHMHPTVFPDLVQKFGVDSKATGRNAAQLGDKAQAFSRIEGFFKAAGKKISSAEEKLPIQELLDLGEPALLRPMEKC